MLHIERLDISETDPVNRLRLFCTVSYTIPGRLVRVSSDFLPAFIRLGTDPQMRDYPSNERQSLK